LLPIVRIIERKLKILRHDVEARYSLAGSAACSGFDWESGAFQMWGGASAGYFGRDVMPWMRAIRWSARPAAAGATGYLEHSRREEGFPQAASVVTLCLEFSIGGGRGPI